MLYKYLIQYQEADGTFCAETADVAEVAAIVGCGKYKDIRVFRLLPERSPEGLWVSHDPKHKDVTLRDIFGNFIESAHYGNPYEPHTGSWFDWESKFGELNACL